MFNTAQMNEASARHRREIVMFELTQVRQLIDAELKLTDTELFLGREEPQWSDRNNTVIFPIHVRTKGCPTVQIVMWQSGDRTELLTAAIQQNLKDKQQGVHQHATNSPG